MSENARLEGDTELPSVHLFILQMKMGDLGEKVISHSHPAPSGSVEY